MCPNCMATQQTKHLHIYIPEDFVQYCFIAKENLTNSLYYLPHKGLAGRLHFIVEILFIFFLFCFFQDGKLR